LREVDGEMRFTPFPKVGPDDVRVTPQRLAAAKRALQRERERAGMFVEELGPRETPEERIARQDAAWVAHWQRMRDRYARAWRDARRLLVSPPAEQRRQLRAEWRTCGWPGTPEYFMTWLKRKIEGRGFREVPIEELIRAAFGEESDPAPQTVEGQTSLF